MKTHHLIFLTTAIFTLLFYKQSVGLNLGIFGLTLGFLVYFTTQRERKDKTYYILFAAGILSSLAYAWYGDFVSFLAVFLSLSLLVFRSRTACLKPVFSLIVIPLNAFSFIVRVFLLNQWLPKTKAGTNFWKQLFAYLILPLLLVSIFFLIYSLGSEHFANMIANWEWNIDAWVILTALLGFYLMFNFWNYSAGKFLEKQSRLFQNDFMKTPDTEQSTLPFMDVSMERTSGVISFICLNVLLLIYVLMFNYEQFFENQPLINNLSSETHERVNAVILSILMAIALIMFYFKGSFNFDKKAKILKVLAIIWIALNAVLVFSAFAKNTEYIYQTDLLTYKRLGVYAFLILSLIGLFYTFIKIQKRKTNAFLFNRMFWYFYGVTLVCSFINWGDLITRYNITKPGFDENYHIQSIQFNEKILKKYAGEKGDSSLDDTINNHIWTVYGSESKRENFLSKTLYYESMSY